MTARVKGISLENQPMKENLQRLAEMARDIAAPEAVEENEFGFSLDTGDATLSFFAPTDENGAAQPDKQAKAQSRRRQAAEAA